MKATVLADPRRLHQVITKLLTNAPKFTPASGRVTIGTFRMRSVIDKALSPEADGPSTAQEATE